jgi:hypothetical protein
VLLLVRPMSGARNITLWVFVAGKLWFHETPDCLMESRMVQLAWSAYLNDTKMTYIL